MRIASSDAAEMTIVVLMWLAMLSQALYAAERFDSRYGGVEITLPPVEYDHPFDGPVQIIEHPVVNLRFVCAAGYPGGKPPPDWSPYGCASVNHETCIIHIGDEQVTNTGVRLNRDAVLRHELGHCNGWSKDHPSPRYYSEDASGKPLVQFPPYVEQGE